jgi:hypothetical protein
MVGVTTRKARKSMNLYRLKPASLRAVEPLIAYCVRRRVRPDTLTFLAVLVAFIGAVTIAASPEGPLGFPMVASAIDGPGPVGGVEAERIGSTGHARRVGPPP